MEKYQKILAVVDPTTEDQKALKRAIELARKTGASITAFLTIYDFSYEMSYAFYNDVIQVIYLIDLDVGEVTKFECKTKSIFDSEVVKIKLWYKKYNEDNEV